MPFLSALKKEKVNVNENPIVKLSLRESNQSSLMRTWCFCQLWKEMLQKKYFLTLMENGESIQTRKLFCRRGQINFLMSKSLLVLVYQELLKDQFLDIFTFNIFIKYYVIQFAGVQYYLMVTKSSRLIKRQRKMTKNAKNLRKQKFAFQNMKTKMMEYMLVNQPSKT